MKKKQAVLQGAFSALGILLIAGTTASLLIMRSQAQSSVTTTTTVNNEAPSIVVGSEKFCMGAISNGDSANSCSNVPTITPPSGGTISGQIVAIVRDSNGYTDVSSGTARLYFDSGAETEACSSDANLCLHQNTCTFVGQHTGQASTDQWMKCQFTFQYFSADSSSGAVGDEVWKGYLSISDGALGANNLGNEYTMEVAKVVAATFPVIGFGPRNVDSSTTSGNNLDLLHQNNGNVPVDIQVSLDDDDANSQLDCDEGGIDVGNIEWNFDNGATAGDLAYNSAGNTDLVDENDGGAPQTMDITVCQRTNDSASQGPTNPRTSGVNSDQDCTVTNANADDQVYSYWNLSVPPSGVGGSCSEGLNVTIVESV